MTINERISKARGECRHKEFDFVKRICLKCKLSIGKGIPISDIIPQYDSDPAAWTPELYQWIEDEGLDEQMQCWLYAVLHDEPEVYGKGQPIIIGSLFMWMIIKATPLQKATALSRAIEERS